MFTATMNWPILGRLAVLAGVVLCGFAQSSVAQETKPASPPTTQPTSRPATVDPPTKGITTEESDPAAVALADITMKAMGGRQAWTRRDISRGTSLRRAAISGISTPGTCASSSLIENRESRSSC